MPTLNRNFEMKFLKLKDVINLTGLSRLSIYAKISSGDFPSQFRLGERSVAWLETDVFEWMENCCK